MHLATTPVVALLVVSVISVLARDAVISRCAVLPVSPWMPALNWRVASSWYPVWITPICTRALVVVVTATIGYYSRWSIVSVSWSDIGATNGEHHHQRQEKFENVHSQFPLFHFLECCAGFGSFAVSRARALKALITRCTYAMLAL